MQWWSGRQEGISKSGKPIIYPPAQPTEKFLWTPMNSAIQKVIFQFNFLLMLIKKLQESFCFVLLKFLRNPPPPREVYILPSFVVKVGLGLSAKVRAPTDYKQGRQKLQFRVGVP